MSDRSSSTLLGRLSSAKRLPSPPGVALRVLELARREDTDVQQVAAVIMSDPVLSMRLLKYANLGSLSAGRQVASVRDAAVLLGLRAVKLTALGFSLAVPEFQPSCPSFDMRRFWSESLATALVARRLAVGRFQIEREEAFTAGLLSGIGRLAFACGLPEKYARALAAVEAGRSLIETERDMFGLDHLQLGAKLFEEWGLPAVLVQALAFQHRPVDSRVGWDPPGQLTRVVRAALRLAPPFVDGRQLAPEVRELSRDLIKGELELNEASWQKIAEEVAVEYGKVAPVFNVELSAQQSVFDLYAEAQEEVTRVSMVAQLERSEALEEHKALLQRATTDPLTEVANRGRFDERLSELLDALHQRGDHFALLLFDIDHFKRVNDAHGHDVGDLVLKHMARAVFRTLRPVDLLARYGGEEFAILAPGGDRRDAFVMAARTCKIVKRAHERAGYDELTVTISAGLALTSDCTGPLSAAKLIAEADKQLYLSKRNGRNTWSYLGRTVSRLTAGARSS
jgi:diguanylate cyclase (GGDEF)-like protein